MTHLLLLSASPHLSQTQSANSLFRTIPKAQIDKDWSGVPLASPLSYSLSLFENTLNLSGAISTQLKPQAAQGFRDKLWESDVVEVFLGHTSQEQYLELNLAPSGAWWAQSFESYRKPSSEKVGFERLQPRIESRLEQNSWEFSFSIDLPSLPKPEELSCNVTAIFGTEERQYLSAVTPPKDITQPDFHLSSLRRAPLLIPTSLGQKQ